MAPGWPSRDDGKHHVLRIVLCDPYTLFAQAFSAVLEARGHDVLACPMTLDEARTILSWQADQRVPVDVIVMELALSDERGPKAVRLIHEHAPTIPIVVLTASNDTDDIEAALAAGADGVVIKTESVDEVERLLLSVTAAEFTVLRESANEKVLSRRVQALFRAPSQKRDLRKPTRREFEVIRFLVEGKTTEDIATLLNMQTATVRTHLRHLFEKMGVHSRLQLIALAVREGLVEQSAGDEAERTVPSRR